VNISTGEPLSGPRKQQSILLHRQDEHFKAKSSPGVRALANLKEGEIKDWERAAISGAVRPEGTNLLETLCKTREYPRCQRSRMVDRIVGGRTSTSTTPASRFRARSCRGT
jgi:hypothetical protein